MEINLLPELCRRVPPKYWHSGRPLGNVSADEIQAAREVLAECDPWTQLAYSRWYPSLFGHLAPDPLPPVLRD
jgi:hypothetical protein